MLYMSVQARRVRMIYYARYKDDICWLGMYRYYDDAEQRIKHNNEETYMLYSTTFPFPFLHIKSIEMYSTWEHEGICQNSGGVNYGIYLGFIFEFVILYSL